MAQGSQNMTSHQANKWTNLRTFTIGLTGHDVDGTSAVTWTLDQMLGASTSAYFYRGDKTWSNELDNNFYLNGHLYLDSGKHIYMNYLSSDWPVLNNHNNGNISVNGAGSHLDLGYFYTPVTRMYYTNSDNTVRTQFFEINSNGAYALTRFGVNGQDTDYRLYVNGTSYLSGDTTIAGNVSFGSSNTSNYISIHGLTGDAADTQWANHYFIGNRHWANTESSELVLFAGNDIGNGNSATTVSGSGPDRIRHIAGAHLFQTYSAAVSGEFETVCTSSSLVNVFEVNTNRLVTHKSLYINQPSDARRNGIVGTYDYTKAAAIWSMGDSYQIATDGSSLGSLYGAAYVYQGQGGTGGKTLAGGHQFVWAENGGVDVALGGNGVWIKKNGGIYWDPYVESSSDTSDVTSIYQIASGVAGGTELRINQQNDAADCINLCTNAYIYLNSKRAFTINDSWLRINENAGFSSGTYFGATTVRTDGTLQVGSGGDAFYANSSGNVHAKGNIYIGASHAGGYLYGGASNGGINSILIGDDIWLGDCNIGGRLGLKSNNSADAGISCYGSDGTKRGEFYANSSGFHSTVAVYNAVWNDVAEYRKLTSDAREPGYAIAPSDNGISSRTDTRMQAGARIVSDTYGFCLGYMEGDEENNIPVAISGRVLAYPLRDKSTYRPGDAVCAAEGGRIDKMTRQEIQEYPDRIIGVVNEIPDYDIWEPSLTGGGREPVHTNGRIWIDVR